MRTSSCMPMMWWAMPMRQMMRSAACSTARVQKQETPAATAAEAPAAKPMDVIDTALAAGSFKTLLSAVIAAGLGEALKGNGPFTVFAPGDAAFGALPAGTLEELLKPENKEKLKGILAFHVVSERLTAADILQRTSLRAANGKDLATRFEVTGSAGAEFRGSVRIGEAKVVTADVACTNGVIHVIDRVLIPAE